MTSKRSFNIRLFLKSTLMTIKAFSFQFNCTINLPSIQQMVDRNCEHEQEKYS